MDGEVKGVRKAGKLRIVLVIACCVAVLMLGTVAAYAASDAVGKIMVRNDDGVVTHSADDGATWSQGYPDGAVVTEGENGETFVTSGNFPEGGSGHGLMVKNENGQVLYSTDGVNWSETAPDGVVTNADGSISMKVGN